MATNANPIVWPKPTVQPWDLPNYTNFTSIVGNPDLVNPRALLLSGKSDLDIFVSANIKNVYYDDTLLYPYDGYALLIEANVLD